MNEDYQKLITNAAYQKLLADNRAYQAQPQAQNPGISMSVDNKPFEDGIDLLSKHGVIDSLVNLMPGPPQMIAKKLMGK